jgi:hypothetical protein
MQSGDWNSPQTIWHAPDRQWRNAIIALRCPKLSGRFEDFWGRRSDQATA